METMMPTNHHGTLSPEAQPENGDAKKEKFMLGTDRKKIEGSYDGTGISADRKRARGFLGIKEQVESYDIQKADIKKYGKLRPIREIFSDPETDFFTKKKIQWLKWPQFSSAKKQREIVESAREILEYFPQTKKFSQENVLSQCTKQEIADIIAFLQIEVWEYIDYLRDIRHKHVASLFDERDLHEQYDVLPHHTYLTKEEIHENCIYSRISPKYGCIYDQNEYINTIFTLSGEERNGKLIPKVMELKELFDWEGIDRNQLGKEEYESLLKNYRHLFSPFIRYITEKYFGIQLKEFPIRVQIQFLNFLKSKNEDEAKRIALFLKNGNATDRLKSFLSLEQGGADMGEKILTIGERLPKEAADTVFAKYAEMADRAGEARKNSEKDADAIEAKLLKRGKSLLSWIAEHAEGFAHDERLLSALEGRLESLNAETLLAVNAIRAAKESGNAEGIQEFLDGSFRILKGGDLSVGAIAEMESLYRMSYPSDREKQFREKLVNDLHEKKISDKNARFYTFFMGEQGKESLRAFCSFQDDVSDGSVYFGAFNVDEFFSGEKMGCLMMDESLEREAKDHMVRAACILEKLISEHYIEKRGFVGKSFSNLEGIDLLAIERDDKNVGRYETKRMTQEEVIRKSEAGFRDFSRTFLSVPERSFSRESIEAAVKDGFVLTRMFRGGEGDVAKVYLAFESEK